MDVGAYFSESYLGAHDKFVSACRALRLLPQSYWVSSGHGDSDPPLVDSVRLGDPSARQILVVCGGDRQADALCCSAIEIGWLNEFAKATLPRDTAILLVHHGAAPPSGGEPPPRGGPPPVWEDDLLAKVERRYAEYARQKGVDSLGAPLDAPEVQGNPGYPGTLLDALAKWLGSAAAGRVALAEIRVGLGAYGVAEITPCHPPGTAAAGRVRSWFGLTEPAEEQATLPQEPDSMAAGLIRRLPDAEVTVFSAAFGTYSMMSVLDSLTRRPEGAAVPDPRQLLFPSDEAWRSAVWRGAVITIQRTLTALRAN